jgi:hypothetical protein
VNRVVAVLLGLFAAAIVQAQTPPKKDEWLLVWVAVNVSAASLPEQQRFETKEQCQAAAQTLMELTAKGITSSNVPLAVRAACIDVPASSPGPAK